MEEIRWGRRIRAFRRLKLIKQAELANKINVSITKLSQIEQGKRVPSEEQLEQIALVFDIKLEELKGETKEGECMLILSCISEAYC